MFFLLTGCRLLPALSNLKLVLLNVLEAVIYTSILTEWCFVNCL